MHPLLVLLLLACADPVKIGVLSSESTDTGHTGSPPDTSADPAPDTGAPLESVPGVDWSRPEVDPDALPAEVRTVNLRIDADALARLDADPFHAPDEAGVFVDEDGVEHAVDLSYRGAYALLNVMRSYDLRNWKVKFAEDDPYQDRREWNFNYEPHFSAQMSWDLMRFAGVAVPEAEHVVLQVNGEYQGVYLQYADPDNKAWLQDWFGDDEGDLYKAAYDLPYEPQYFALLDWLGDEDADYLYHYTKKTNDEANPEDVAVLRAFLDDLNHLDDDAFAAWVEGAVDVDSLINYLVVSNFVSNWDSYPQRPKNYWLYEDRRSGRMVYIPWDLDNTFSPYVDSTFNKMGTGADPLYNLIESEYAPVNEGEGTDRPLVRRLFADEAIQERYLARYAELSETILSEDYLNTRLSALHDQLLPYASATDQSRMESAKDAMESFIDMRTSYLRGALAGSTAAP